MLGLDLDASIRRLKGPMNSLQTRVDVLEAIQYIDVRAYVCVLCVLAQFCRQSRDVGLLQTRRKASPAP